MGAMIRFQFKKRPTPEVIAFMILYAQQDEGYEDMDILEDDE